MKEQQKSLLESFAAKAFSIGSQDDNLELLLSQKAEFRKEVLQNELQRNNTKTLVFEVFPDEIY